MNINHYTVYSFLYVSRTKNYTLVSRIRSVFPKKVVGGGVFSMQEGCGWRCIFHARGLWAEVYFPCKKVVGGGVFSMQEGCGRRCIFHARRLWAEVYFPCKEVVGGGVFSMQGGCWRRCICHARRLWTEVYLPCKEVVGGGVFSMQGGCGRRPKTGNVLSRKAEVSVTAGVVQKRNTAAQKAVMARQVFKVLTAI